MRKTFASLSLLLLAQGVSAFTPESGFYWNPAQGGRGFSIEIQDNYLFLAGYVYATDGTPIWYTAQGNLTVTSQQDRKATYTGVLDRFVNGQCITCNYRAPTAQLGSGGNFRIDFSSETRATITWAGGSLPIQRFDYALTPPGGKAYTDTMLGQWQTLVDFAGTATTGNTENQMYAEILNFNSRSSDSSEDYFDGCSVYNSQQRGCTANDLAIFDASGFHFTVNEAGVVKDTLLIVVPYSTSQFIVYFVDYGTNSFSGVAKLCNRSIPTSQLYSRCLQVAGGFFRARGFRTHSRSYQAGNDAAPSALAPTPKLVTRMLPQRAHMTDAGLSAEAVLVETGIDVRQVPPLAFERLVERIAAD